MKNTNHIKGEIFYERRIYHALRPIVQKWGKQVCEASAEKAEKERHTEAGTGYAMRKFRIAKIGYNVISTLFLLAALLYLLFPQISSLAVCLFSGLTLLAYGCIKIIGYFSEDLFCLAFRYDFAFGLLLLALGCIVLAKSKEAAAWLSPGIGWLSLLDSALKVQMSEEAKKFGLERWNIISTTAVITGILGVFLILKSAVQTESTHTLTAIVLISVGLMNQCVIHFMTQHPKRHYKANRRD